MGHALLTGFEGNLVIVNAGVAGMAFDKNTGALAWSNGGGVGGYATPVVFSEGSNRLVAIFVKDRLAVVNAATGKLQWSFPWATDCDVNAADPIIVGDTMFISSGYDRGCALLQFSGTSVKKLWESKAMSNHFATCILINGYLYGCDGNAGAGKLKCIEMKTGKEMWTKNTGFGSLMSADGKLLYMNESGKCIIVEASPAGYTELASKRLLTDVCWTAPLLIRGRLLLRNQPGQILCIAMK